MNESIRPILIVIAGPNGSGKTSITQKVLQHEWPENLTYINPYTIAFEKLSRVVGVFTKHNRVLLPLKNQIPKNIKNDLCTN